MKNIRSSFYLLVFFLLISGCQKDEEDHIAIEVTPSNLNFGDTDLDGAMQSFTIYNSGNVDLNVNNITSTNSNFFIDWDFNVIEVNDSRLVKVYFFPTSSQQFNGQIVISSNAPDVQYVTVTGKGSCNGFGILKLSNNATTTHKVIIDGVNYGFLYVNETKEYSLPSGNHSFTIPTLNGTGCTTPANVIITECGTQSFYCIYD